ncbi:MAG TPA: hypothetical protein VKU03_05625 [Roseiarcus sp.]|nr:hypothetical protein [Roseiarcus sp.]
MPPSLRIGEIASRTGRSIHTIRWYGRALLADHRARVRETIERWGEALALLDAKVDYYDEWVASGARPAVAPHRRVRRRGKI